MTGPAIHTGRARRGRCARSRRSWPTPATPADKSGTDNPPTIAKPNPATNTPAPARYDDGTRKTSGCTPPEPCTPPLVSDADFTQAQTITAVATPKDGRPRRYLLTAQTTIICDAETITLNVHPNVNDNGGG
jgi:hypothetical protein